MKKWPRRVRGVVGMGLTWAAGWAVVGVLIGVTSKLLPDLPWWDSFFKVFDAPLPALAIPGFFGGVFFSIVLGIAGRGRRFGELSLPRFTAWGAVGGVLLSLFPAALVAVGLASVRQDASVWPLTATIIGPFTLLSAVSAAGYLMLARMVEGRDLPDDSEGVAEMGLAGGDAQELLAGGDWSLHGRPAAGHGERARPDPASGASDG
ncbi:MAG: hypothetical protein ACRENI_01050 [Gemmatimonadaceae bacterium]